MDLDTVAYESSLLRVSIGGFKAAGRIHLWQNSKPLPCQEIFDSYFRRVLQLGDAEVDTKL